MNKLKKFCEYLKNPKKFIIYIEYKLEKNGVFNKLDDEAFLKHKYKVLFGKKLDLDDPQTLNEKIQWLKLYDRKPEYSRMVDKYEVKKYIAEKVGSQYTVPTLGIYDKFDDINFDDLPEKFVIKTTHDSGGLIICTDKKKLNIKETKKKIEKHLNRNFYYWGREWPYKNVKPRILIEPYMVDESGIELKDYKIFCFNGKPEYIEVDFNRFIEHKLNPYDFEWNPLNFCDSSKNDYSADIKKPVRLKEMYDIAKRLSEDMMLLRVDFYSIEDKIYIGELTLHPGSGFIEFDPPETDLKYGQMLSLNRRGNL